MYRMPASVTPDEVSRSCLSNPATSFATSSLPTWNEQAGRGHGEHPTNVTGSGRPSYRMAGHGAARTRILYQCKSSGTSAKS